MYNFDVVVSQIYHKTAKFRGATYLILPSFLYWSLMTFLALSLLKAVSFFPNNLLLHHWKLSNQHFIIVMTETLILNPITFQTS
jgi:hypothetical protein